MKNAYSAQPKDGAIYLGGPARFRKIPRQQRSIALVGALEEACLQIIRNDGANTVTVSNLSELAGVAVTSIYEYFDSIESIVFNTSYNHILQSLEDDFVKYMQLTEDSDLASVVQAMVDGIIRQGKFIYECLYDVFRGCPEQFTSMSVASRNFSVNLAGDAMSATHAILSRYKNDISVNSFNNAAHIYKVALTSTVNNMLCHNPERLYEADTPTIIAGMVYGALNPRRGFPIN